MGDTGGVDDTENETYGCTGWYMGGMGDMGDMDDMDGMRDMDDMGGTCR